MIPLSRATVCLSINIRLRFWDNSHTRKGKEKGREVQWRNHICRSCDWVRPSDSPSIFARRRNRHIQDPIRAVCSATWRVCQEVSRRQPPFQVGRVYQVSGFYEADYYVQRRWIQASERSRGADDPKLYVPGLVRCCCILFCTGPMPPTLNCGR